MWYFKTSLDLPGALSPFMPVQTDRTQRHCPPGRTRSDAGRRLARSLSRHVVDRARRGGAAVEREHPYASEGIARLYPEGAVEDRPVADRLVAQPSER